MKCYNIALVNISEDVMEKPAVSMHLRLPEELHRRLKVEAAQRAVPLKDLIIDRLAITARRPDSDQATRQ